MRGDELEDDLLAAARRGLSPTAADSDRVRAKLFGALAAPDSTPDLADSILPTGGWTSIAAKLLVVSAVAATSASAGYYYGKRDGRAEVASAAHVTPTVVPTFVTELAATAPVPPSGSVLSETKARAAPKALPSAAQPPPSSRSSSDSDALEEEVRTLRRVERALRSKNPQLALVLLQELDVSVPNGNLIEERRAAFTVASCELGFGESQKSLLDGFLSRYPNSVYAPRVRASCRGSSEKSAIDATDPGLVDDSPRRRETQ